MSSYSGAFQYLDEKGTEVRGGPCRVTIEPPNLFVTPQGGPSLSIDLGDIDLLAPGDYQLSLTLYTGKRLVLTKFAKAFQDLSAELLRTYRDRLVDCLLLEDLDEIARFEGHVELEAGEGVCSSPAELRLYRSNLAVLPQAAAGLQWRLADIDGADFDEASYRLTIRSGNDRLVVTKLAKRTGEFVERLCSALDAVSENTAAIVRSLCPFLSPDEALDAARLMREGRAASFSKLNGINTGIEQSLIANAVDRQLKPYFEVLKGKMAGPHWFTGFKMIRPEPEGQEESLPVEEDADGSTEPGTPAQEPVGKNGQGEGASRPVLHWFFFPLAAGTGEGTPNVVAWESASHSGRATYFFRITATPALEETRGAGDLEAAVGRINQALVMLNFRREPVYLPDASLQTDVRYHRYAIACRKISALRELRASYLGRAIHTSVDAWQKQVDAILNT